MRLNRLILVVLASAVAAVAAVVPFAVWRPEAQDLQSQSVRACRRAGNGSGG